MAQQADSTPPATSHETRGTLLVALGILLLLTAFAPFFGGNPEVGALAWMRRQLRYLLSWGMYLLPLVPLAFGFFTFMNPQPTDRDRAQVRGWVMGGVIVVYTLLWLHGTLWAGRGGAAAAVLADPLRVGLGTVLALFPPLVVLAFGLELMLGHPPLTFIKTGLRRLSQTVGRASQGAQGAVTRAVPIPPPAKGKGKEKDTPPSYQELRQHFANQQRELGNLKRLQQKGQKREGSRNIDELIEMSKTTQREMRGKEEAALKEMQRELDGITRMVNLHLDGEARDLLGEMEQESEFPVARIDRLNRELESPDHDLQQLLPSTQACASLEEVRRTLLHTMQRFGVRVAALERQRQAAERRLSRPSANLIVQEREAHSRRLKQWEALQAEYAQWEARLAHYAGWPQVARDYDRAPSKVAGELAYALRSDRWNTLSQRSVWEEHLRQLPLQQGFEESGEYLHDEAPAPAAAPPAGPPPGTPEAARQALEQHSDLPLGLGRVVRQAKALAGRFLPGARQANTAEAANPAQSPEGAEDQNGPFPQPLPLGAGESETLTYAPAAPSLVRRVGPEPLAVPLTPVSPPPDRRPEPVPPPMTIDFGLGARRRPAEARAPAPLQPAAPTSGAGLSGPAVPPPPVPTGSGTLGLDAWDLDPWDSDDPDLPFSPTPLRAVPTQPAPRSRGGAAPGARPPAEPLPSPAPGGQAPAVSPLPSPVPMQASVSAPAPTPGAAPLSDEPQPPLRLQAAPQPAAQPLAQPSRRPSTPPWEEDDADDLPLPSPRPALAAAAPRPAPGGRPQPTPQPAPQPVARVAVAPARQGALPVALPANDWLDPVPDTSHGAAELDRGARQRGQLINETLRHFGLQGKVVDFARGPTVTRYEIEPAPGEKISRIASLSNDLARALAVGGVRVEAPVPGKNVIGLEVPNTEREPVTFHQAVASPAFRNSRAKLPIILGKSIDGTMMVGDLAKMPHLLVAGSTGSGKSVCVNTLITSLLYKYLPSELRFVMVDPKMVELTPYDGIPHLLRPVVTNPADAAGVLLGAVAHMERRYKMMSQVGAKNLEQFNAKMAVTGEPELPHLVIIIDELADLMITSPKEVESAIMRLAQMARATGMHLILATQRPSVDILTSLIKVNIPARIAFAVSSSHDSRTILDTTGAERLTGQGDMLFYQPGLVKPARLQGPYISEGESVKIADELRRMIFEDEFGERYGSDFEGLISSSGPGDRGAMDFSDPLLRDAALICIEESQGSVSRLQRRLSVGHARAGKLMDLLEAMGIVGPHQGSKPREVLITEADLPEYFGK